MNQTIRSALKKAIPQDIRIFVKKLLLTDEQITGQAEQASYGWDRIAIARKYLQGEGIEIGALHNPLTVANTAKVRYVDRMTADQLRQHYPELNQLNLVETDIIDDGEYLTHISDESQDFVIANHFIEHCQNPLMTLENMFRVLKTNGVLYLAIPDKRFTFDAERPVTPLQHIIKDYEQGGEWSKRGHFQEWVRFVSKVTDETEVENHVNGLMAMDYSIHYHAWTQIEMWEFAIALNRKLGLKFDVELFFKNQEECIFIFRKLP